MSSIGRGVNADLLYYLLGYDRKAVRPSLSLPQPDFSRFDCCTKSAPAMSEDEYKQAIIELAQKDAAKGKFHNTEGNNKEYMALKKSFVSVASPDRRGIIAAASRGIWGKGTVTFAEFKDKAGNVIAHYSPNNGWAMIGSPAKNARESEFDSISSC